MTNVIRHAGATRVTVRLEVDPGSVVLTVRDNGLGISEEAVNDPLSLGIIGMRECAHLWGGEVSIRGTKSKGTTLTLTIPLDKEK
jgi:signal transduction histidine kinase